MKIENQVVSLELAKKLKELGVKQESLFAWFHIEHINEHEIVQAGSTASASSWEGDNKHFSAFTVAELGEMLPDFLTEEHLYTYQQYRNWSNKEKPKHGLSYWFLGKVELHCTEADTEADARAKMLVYLLENNLISLPA